MNNQAKATSQLEYYEEFKQMSEKEFEKSRRMLRVMNILSGHAVNFTIGFVFNICVPLVLVFLIFNDISILKTVAVFGIVAYPIVYKLRTHKRVDYMREEYTNAKLAYDEVLAEKDNVS
jgi:uncharacterized membrane protein